MELTRLDRIARWVSPRWALNRMRQRVAFDLMARHYEGASIGRRTQGWKRTSGDANAALSGSISRLRDHARDLVRNNPHAESAVSTIADHTVGWGIVPTPRPSNSRAQRVWAEWAETAACDADGRHNFYGLEKIAMRTIVESGEVLVRRRFRRPDDGLPIPIQLQILEPDFLDTSKTGIRLPNGGVIIQGVEFDALGRRVAYWLFPEHPGSEQFLGLPASQRVPADGVLHVFRQGRPGQVRGPSWFAPVLLALKDFDEYADAQLMKQKVAACLTVIYTDVDGSNAPLGTAIAGEDVTAPELDGLGPGWIGRAPPGADIKVVDPPEIGEYGVYSEITLRAIATGLGVTYEDLTGSYTNMPFSAARMSRLRHWARVNDWRWQTLIPGFCQPVWRWAMQAALIMNRVSTMPEAEWTAPPPPVIEPQAEAAGWQGLLRIGGITWPEMIRERGYDPETVLKEISDWNAKFDEAGIILDGDPRQQTAQGQAIERGGEPEPEPEPDTDDELDAAAMRSIRKLNGKAKRKRSNGEVRA